MSRNGIDRRQLLKLTGSGLAASAIGSIAGCSSVPGLGGGGGGGKINHKQWVFEPSSGTAGYLYYEPKTMASYEDSFGDGWKSQKKFFGRAIRKTTDVDFDEIKAGLGFSSVNVGKTTVSNEDLVSAVEDNDFKEDDDMSGFTIYVRSSGDGEGGGSGPSAGGAPKAAVALKGSTVVTARRGMESTPKEMVEKAIGAKNGEEDRALEENDDLKKLNNVLGLGNFALASAREEAISGDQANADEGRFEGQIATGTKWKFGSDQTNLTGVRVFEEADQIDTEAIKEYVESSNDNYESISVSKSGRAAKVTATIATDDLFTTTEQGTTGSKLEPGVGPAPGR